MNTFTTVLERAGVTVADDTLADIEVPVLTGPQRQGDVLIIPATDGTVCDVVGPIIVPAKGVAVVVGEATGNTHLLQPEPGCVIEWQPTGRRSTQSFNGDDMLLGVLSVPEGATAWLIHTDEHGANGIGPGTYRLHGKREQADKIRRVAD